MESWSAVGTTQIPSYRFSPSQVCHQKSVGEKNCFSSNLQGKMIEHKVFEISGTLNKSQ